jgi:hypothetical protein
VTGLEIGVNGETVELLPEGALWWRRERLLAVADLHFEKGSAFAVRGQFLPPYDTRATLNRLCALSRKFSPRTIVALGDSFHDREGPDRMASGDAKTLRALTDGCEFVWITGNHDADAAAACGGAAVEVYRRGGLTFRHEPHGSDHAGEICGHLHPKACVAIKGRRISRFCFLSDGRRMVMPAFGAFTGGLDALDPAFFPVFPAEFSAYLLGKERVYPFPVSRLATRPAA